MVVLDGKSDNYGAARIRGLRGGTIYWQIMEWKNSIEFYGFIKDMNQIS